MRPSADASPHGTIYFDGYGTSAELTPELARAIADGDPDLRKVLREVLSEVPIPYKLAWAGGEGSGD